MPEKTYCIRGRQLGDVEISAIRATVAEHWDKGRTAISKILCERWDWRQANGLLKERACRVLLLSLEKKGAISSLERSYEIAKKNFAFSAVLMILIAVLNSIGGLVRIGVLITIPFTSLCICLVANKLTAKKK